MQPTNTLNDTPEQSHWSGLDTPSFRDQQKDSRGYYHLQFFIEGMRCAQCMFRIEGIKNKMPSITQLSVNMGDHSAQLTINPEGSFAAVMTEIEKLGFLPHPVTKSGNDHHYHLDPNEVQKKIDGTERKKFSVQNENRSLLMKVGVAGAATANIMLLAIAIYGGADEELARVFHGISCLLFLPVLFFSAQPFFINTWRALKNYRPSVDLPIAVALACGGGLSTWNLVRGKGDIYFDSLSALVFLLLGSRYLLARTQQRYLGPSFWQPFLDLKTVCRVDPDGQSSQIISLNDVKEGDVILVKRGEKIPVDGKLREERAYLNTALLTGETRAQKMLRGETCFAGTYCASDSLTLTTSAIGEATRVGQILAKMNREFFCRTPLIALADRAAQIFTLFILLLGGGFFIFYSPIDFQEALNRSLALVILACPCALAFATPLVQSLALQAALRRGFLIKKAESLEKLTHIKEVVFDKTGTLTEGDFKWMSWTPASPSPEILTAIFALESRSDHPIARALTQKLSDYQLDAERLSVSEVKELLGKGIKGKVGDHQLEILRSTGTLPQSEDQELLTNAIDIFWDGQFQTQATFGDRLRADASSTLKKLQELGLKCFVLSGDKASSVITAADQLNLSPDQVLGEQSPEQKSEFIKSHPLAVMVGDGANDTVAMASSYVGMAVKGSMEASLHAADIYLARPGVNSVLEVILLGRQALKVIRRNLAISVVYNLICGTAALLGYINPLVAAVLMPLNSAIVVMSSVLGSSLPRAPKELKETSSL